MIENKQRMIFPKSDKNTLWDLIAISSKVRGEWSMSGSAGTVMGGKKYKKNCLLLALSLDLLILYA